jgi:hypothetical protein
MKEKKKVLIQTKQGRYSLSIDWCSFPPNIRKTLPFKSIGTTPASFKWNISAKAPVTDE